jgi:hypothetical protein
MKRTRPTAPVNVNWRDYEVFLEAPLPDGRSRAYVCIDPHRREGSVQSRFVWRLNLPATYASRREAKKDANEVLRRFFSGHLGANSFEVSVEIQGYRITGKARFRGDVHEWEPWLEVADLRHPKRRPKLEGADAIFYRNTFTSRETAARFALRYGERMVLGMLSRLKS